MKFKILLITFGLILVYQGPLFAQDRNHDRADYAQSVRVLVRVLDLTEDQVTLFRELIGSRAAALRSNAEQIQMTQQQIEEEMQNEAPDPLIIGELVLTVRMLKQEAGPLQEDFQMAFRSMLTPTQLERIAQINRIALMNRAAEALGQLKLR